MQSPSRSATRRLAALLAAGSLVLASLACGQQQRIPLQSLDTPSAVAVGELERCVEGSGVYAGFGRTDGSCAIGLVASSGSNRLALADLSGRRPELIDLEPGSPGNNHLKVDRYPTDVALSPDATTAYTLHSTDGTVGVVDVPRLRIPESSLRVRGTLKELELQPNPDGGHRLVVATQRPNRLWLHPGVDCPAPGTSGDCTGFGAEGQSISLPGRPADLAVAPSGDRLYAVYSDQNYLSVVALPTADGDRFAFDGTDRTCRGSRSSPPCEVDRIGLTTGCRDGLDNDDDGRVDRADPQCYGPDGAESPEGIGRTPTGACADGIDNDGDGDIDRNDADCLRPGSSSEQKPFVDDRSPPACRDGEDNDGDGETDYPDDPDCYGATGRSESDVSSTGFQSLGLDRLGRFLYVVDRRDDQILTVDPAEGELIDAGRATSPEPATVGAGLGVGIGGHASRVRGILDRSIVWTDPEDASHGIVRYDYGALAASDDGNVYIVDAMRTYCELEESGDLLDEGSFHIGADGFADAREKECLTVPSLPPEKSEVEEACSDLAACRRCRTGEDDCSGDPCTFDEEGTSREQKRRRCRTGGRRLGSDAFEGEGVEQLVANPRFAVRDGQTRRNGRIQGLGQCEEPPDFRAALDNAQDDLDEPVSLGCDSPLRPQPLARGSVPEQTESIEPLEPLERADLLSQYELKLEADEGGSGVTETVQTRRPDWRLRSESWTVSYEGVLPQSAQSNGLFEEDNPSDDKDDDEQTLFHRGPELCTAGVQTGDRLIIQSDPTSGGCDEFRRSSDETNCRHPYLTYTVTGVSPQRLTFQPVGTYDGGNCSADDFADSLPSHTCFPEGIEYEVRPEDQWIVHGEKSGYVSDRKAVDGTCVERFGAGALRRSGRVETGREFFGPYLQFQLFGGHPAGPEPIRADEAYTYQFDVEAAYSPARIGTGASLPTDMRLVETLEATGRLLVMSDGSGDFVYVRNLQSGRETVMR